MKTFIVYLWAILRQSLVCARSSQSYGLSYEMHGLIDKDYLIIFLNFLNQFSVIISEAPCHRLREWRTDDDEPQNCAERSTIISWLNSIDLSVSFYNAVIFLVDQLAKYLKVRKFFMTGGISLTFQSLQMTDFFVELSAAQFKRYQQEKKVRFQLFISFWRILSVKYS